MIATRRIHDNPPLLRQSVNFECRKEQVQQAGVVAVAHIFNIQLPIVRQQLRETSNDLYWAMEHTLYSCADVFTQVFLDREHFIAEAAEHQSRKTGDTQFPWAVILFTKSGRHPAFTFDSLLERHAGKVALAVVTPCVIDTLKTVSLS